jgi:hypothetical protein
MLLCYSDNRCFTMAPPKKKAPTSKFKSSPAGFDSPFKSGRKDDRHVLMYEGVHQGLISLYLKKAGEEAEPYFRPDLKFLKENPSKMEELNINAILSRKGTDGDFLPQTPTSQYPWKQFVLIVGENNNTPAKRKQYAEALVRHFNTMATSPTYTYPRKVKLGSDLTQRPLRPVDSVLLDMDVLGFIMAAYEGTRLEKLVKFDGIMKTFWTDLAHGRKVVNGAAALENDEEAKIVNGLAAQENDDDDDEEGGEGDEDDEALVDSDDDDN